MEIKDFVQLLLILFSMHTAQCPKVTKNVSFPLKQKICNFFVSICQNLPYLIQTGIISQASFEAFCSDFQPLCSPGF